MGMGGGDNQPSLADNAAVNTAGVNQVGISSESSYLIVDLRDRADYLAWHIKESYSMPLILVNQDKTIPEVHRFKNQEGKKIIVYTTDERNGIVAARAMVDRGYENSFLLTGGIQKFIEDYPNLIEGSNIPQLVTQPSKGQQPARRR